MDYIIAFLVGGIVCALVQILMEKTKLMPGRIMVLLVCTGSILGFLNIYQPFQEFAGAGASVPLLGFGNVLWKGVKEAVDKEGFIGIFMGGFKASAVGISAALIFGYLASFIVHMLITSQGFFYGNISIFKEKSRKRKYISLGLIAVLVNSLLIVGSYYLIENKWKHSHDLTLSEIINDIISLDVEKIR